MLGPEGAEAWPGRRACPSEHRASRKEVPVPEEGSASRCVALSPRRRMDRLARWGGGPEGERSPTEGRGLEGGAGRQPDG